jgi:hypothetical protein
VLARVSGTLRGGVQLSLAAGLAGVVAYIFGIPSLLGFGWEFLLAPLALSLAAIGFAALDSIVSPTPGKILWLAGVGLLVSPVVIDEVSALAFFAGVAVLGIAERKRLDEVFNS